MLLDLSFGPQELILQLPSSPLLRIPYHMVHQHSTSHRIAVSLVSRFARSDIQFPAAAVSSSFFSQVSLASYPSARKYFENN